MHHLIRGSLIRGSLIRGLLTRGLLGLTGAFALGFVSTTMASAQATINDCEKIQAADAYNQCLAKFGPTSKVKSLEPERPGDIKGSSAEAAAAAGPPKGAVAPAASAPKGKASRRVTKGSRRGRAVRGRSGGRKRMTFSVGKRRHR